MQSIGFIVCSRAALPSPLRLSARKIGVLVGKVIALKDTAFHTLVVLLVGITYIDCWEWWGGGEAGTVPDCDKG